MKKSIVSIFLILICYIGYGQWPITQNLGSANTLVQVPANGGLRANLINRSYADTTAANLGYSDAYPGSLIFTTDIQAMWLRNAAADGWIQIMPSGGSGGSRPWLIGGQGGLFTSPVDPQYIGVTTSQGFGILTNNVARLTISSAGAWGLGAGLDYGTSGYVLTSNGSGSAPTWQAAGAGATPTWQQTLTAGSTLTGANTITMGGNDFTFSNAGTLIANTSEGSEIKLEGTFSRLIGHGATDRSSQVVVEGDLLDLHPSLGALEIDTLLNNTAQNTLMGWVQTAGGDRGEVGYITLGSGLSLAAGVLSNSGVVSTPTWQQTLTAGSTLTGSNTIDVNGTDLFFYDAQTIEMQAVNGSLSNSLAIDGVSLVLAATSSSTTRESNIAIYSDSIHIEPSLGNLYIDTLTNLSTQDELLGRRNSTGQVGYITVGSGLSLAAGVLTATGSGTTWNAITNPTGDQALTFDAGESSTWTDANTTEDLFTVNSSTGTTNSMFSLNRTGTALAAGNNILELVSSGANGTNAITVTGLNVSVTNTNATSGTNIGAAFAASGATTANYSAQFTGAIVPGANDGSAIGTTTRQWSDLFLAEGGVINWDNGDVTMTQSGNNLTVDGGAFIVTNAEQTPASFTSTFAGNMQVNWNSSTGNNVNFVFQDAGTIRWYVGNNSATGSDRLHILNQSASEAVTVLQGLQVGINNTAPTARLHIGAGAATASYAPFKLTTGTSNTVAEAGAMEYTTPQLFFTNGRAVRQEIFQAQQARVSTQYDNTTTTLGNVTGLTVNVAASGTYRFEAKLFTTSDVAGGVKVAIGGTATATAIRYEGLTTDAGLTTQGRATALGSAVGAVTAVTAAYVTITGTITVNAAGTLTVQAAANAATGTTSVLTGSTFVLTEML